MKYSYLIKFKILNYGCLQYHKYIRILLYSYILIFSSCASLRDAVTGSVPEVSDVYLNEATEDEKKEIASYESQLIKKNNEVKEAEKVIPISERKIRISEVIIRKYEVEIDYANELINLHDLQNDLGKRTEALELRRSANESIALEKIHKNYLSACLKNDQNELELKKAEMADIKAKLDKKKATVARSNQDDTI